MSSIGDRLRNFNFTRKIVYAIVGIVSYPGLAIINKIKISGTEHLKDLPRQNVLFVSNHQTYFCRRDRFPSYFLCGKMGQDEQAGHSLVSFKSFYPCKLCSGGRDHEG